MARNKIETEFREKLSQREIAPSPAAWDRLDAMLAVAEQQKPKKKYNWMYIAAGIVGFLMITGIFFRNQQTSGTEVVIENKQELKSLPIEDKPQELIIPSPSAVALSEQVVAPPAESNKSKPIRQTKSDTQQSQLANNMTPNATLIPNMVIAEAATADVDVLLAQVPSNEINKPVVKVDPRSLLSQVDGELELSFREKVIRSANKNLQNVKVALANRNLE